MRTENSCHISSTKDKSLLKLKLFLLKTLSFSDVRILVADSRILNVDPTVGGAGSTFVFNQVDSYYPDYHDFNISDPIFWISLFR